jgi:hypothetical protein
VRARIAAELADQPEPSPRAMVRALLIQVLPLDEQRRREGHALFAFLAEEAGAVWSGSGCART